MRACKNQGQEILHDPGHEADELRIAEAVVQAVRVSVKKVLELPQVIGEGFHSLQFPLVPQRPFRDVVEAPMRPVVFHLRYALVWLESDLALG